MKRLSLFLIAIILFGGPTFSQTSQLSPAEEKKLVTYLRSHWKSPEDYVVGKLSDHDLVFIGETHHLKQQVELILNLIPRLYKAGVHNLGMEFAEYDSQGQIDRLINAEKYDESLARLLLFRHYVTWGYKEYEDIYRKAWELNHSLPKGAPRFRVVGLNYRPNWPALQETMTREQWQKVWNRGERDEYMAQVIMKEFVDKGEKALIFSGAHHAFTRYKQPFYDFQNKKLFALNEKRMGNIVYARIPNRVFNVYLHAPWFAKTGYSQLVYPLGGVIEQVMRNFKNRRVAFDAVGSPFGDLTEEESLYVFGHDGFTLSMFCDGYVFLVPIKDYEGCTVDEAFVTKGNLQEAIDYFPDFQMRKKFAIVEDLMKDVRQNRDVKYMFRTLK